MSEYIRDGILFVTGPLSDPYRGANQYHPNTGLVMSRQEQKEFEMKIEQEHLRADLKKLADARCKRKHRDYYESLVCVGPGSGKGFGPPCDECLAEVEREYKAKLCKAKREKKLGIK